MQEGVAKPCRRVYEVSGIAARGRKGKLGPFPLSVSSACL